MDLDVAEKRGASNIRVFGPFVRGDATVDSNIDLLVDFDATHRGLDLFAFEREVGQLLGYRVEAGTEVDRFIRDKVDSE